MNETEFAKLHASCVTAFESYIVEAEKTSVLLANCTAGPLPFAKRLRVMLQENAEFATYSLYLDSKRLLHDAARLGYAFF
ncbi:MAG: hypothetical protein JWO71_4743 [Candidatus Acidoferrum typicum]|nr:hypothetical protein [Candidatus Acidoferrum typicum]